MFLLVAYFIKGEIKLLPKLQVTNACNKIQKYTCAYRKDKIIQRELFINNLKYNTV